MATRKSKALLYQKVAVGVGIALTVLLIIYLSTVVITDTPIGGYEEGTHYQRVENPRRIRGDRVEIMEFFSYGCPHCYNLEDYLAGWRRRNETRVDFVRSPVIFNDAWRGYAQSYYTADKLGVADEVHHALFDEVQRKRNPTMSLVRISEIFEDSGVAEEDFKREFNSPGVRRQVDLADQRQRRYRIASVPSIVVNGKYVVATSASVGLSRMLDVVDHLIEQEIAEHEAEGGE